MANNESSYKSAQALISEVEKVVIGKHNEIVLLVTAMLAGGHVLIEDVPGTGKTLSRRLLHVRQDLTSTERSSLPTLWLPISPDSTSTTDRRNSLNSAKVLL